MKNVRRVMPIVVVSICLFTSLGAKAEGDPVLGPPMHKMMMAQMCLQGQSVGGPCGSDLDTIKSFRKAAMDSQKIMLSRNESSSTVQADIAGLFGRIQKALNALEESVKNNDAVQRKAALLEIKKAMNEGHKKYAKR